MLCLGVENLGSLEIFEKCVYTNSYLYSSISSVKFQMVSDLELLLFHTLATCESVAPYFGRKNNSGLWVLTKYDEMVNL